MRFPPKFLFVHVNKRCNLRCQHCAFWKLDDADKPNYLPWERKRDILSEFAEMSPGASVVICGGESMLDLEDYLAISKECTRLGLRSLSVINGTRIQRAEMADRMIREGPDEVSVSLNSHVEALHDRTRGVTGAFRRAVTALRLLLEARQRTPARGNRIYAMGLIFDENYRELDAFYDFVLNDIKADKLKLNFIQPSFGNHLPEDDFFRNHHRVDPELLISRIQLCDEKYRLNINPVWLANVRMYFQSLQTSPVVHLGWRAPTGTSEHICNSYERNVMVDHYGMARLCFAPAFPGMMLEKYGDLRAFWESSGNIRAHMAQCNRYCGISHSVRRENCTLKFPVSTGAPTLRLTSA
jgi:MoaA/NifB/PqqE/SkfB family radical SAM enzyme